MEGNDEELLREDLDQDHDTQFEQEGLEQYPDDFDEEGLGDGEYFEEMDATAPEPKPLGGIYSLFNTVLNKPDSTKVSNLNKTELGELGISVREGMRIALLARTFHHPIFARFFEKQAGIISDSSMSKEGWFTELFVTSKKYASRASSSDVSSLPHFDKGKWRMFSKKNKSNQ